MLDELLCKNSLSSCYIMVEVVSKSKIKDHLYWVTYCDRLTGSETWEVKLSTEICSNFLCSLFKWCSVYFSSSSFFVCVSS